MQFLKSLLDATVDQSVFALHLEGESRFLSPEELRTILNRREWGDEERRSAIQATLVVSGETLVQLVDQLRPLLRDYIDPNEEVIGCGWPGGRSDATSQVRFGPNAPPFGQFVTSLDSFARSLVRAAAILGSEKVTSLFSGWLQGEPLKFRTSVVIDVPGLEDSLELVAGVHTTPLPRSTDKLPASLYRTAGETGEEYIGRTLLSVDYYLSPPLFRPQVDRSEVVVDASPKSNVGVETVCQALSLVLDTNVEPDFGWNDFQELDAFDRPIIGMILTYDGGAFANRRHRSRTINRDLHSGVLTIARDSEPTQKVDPDQIRDVLHSLVESDLGRIRPAVSRWIKSKSERGDIADSFIDLRIALESLYLKDFLGDRSQEMRFRLPLFGAWYLGSNLIERRQIRRTLRDAYDMASAAAHDGYIDPATENRELLVRSQDLCRQGILKYLREGPPDDWGDLVLGAQYD